MASAMPDIFRIERPFPNGDWLLFLAAKSKKGTGDVDFNSLCVRYQLHSWPLLRVRVVRGATPLEY